MEKDLYKDFNERYTGEMNDLFEELRTSPSVEIAKTNLELLRNKLLIIDYLNLCSEEFYWFKKGRIPIIVWRNWVNGIYENLLIEEVYNVFKKEENRYKKFNTYYGFIKYMKSLYCYRKL